VWQANALYETIARLMCANAIRVDVIVQAQQKSVVKHDVWASSEDETRALTINRLRTKFKIPLSMCCNMVTFCKIKSGGNFGGSASVLFGHLRCRMFIFSDYIYLVSAHSYDFLCAGVKARNSLVFTWIALIVLRWREVMMFDTRSRILIHVQAKAVS
jgi:hypothetical protein